MTPLQSVLFDVKQRIENDKKLSKLRQKVNSGKATYADTAAYSTHVGNLLGDTFAQHILSVSPELREALTVELMHDRYMDINAIIDRVQKSMDEAQGLHLAPQHAPFYDDRAHQIGSALADPTVPDETIKRRARAATATATKSMHDDRMKTEAKFRSRAGLKCFITRNAVSGCCEWCTAIAGRYAYGEEPDDIYRRHDNCDCTVTFENGRKRQDVWSKREWEVPEPGAGAGDPVVFTAEQAKALQDEKQLKVLTNGEKHDRIKLGINLFDTSDDLYVEAFSIEEETGFTDIYLHGTPSSVQIKVNGKPKNLSPAEFEQLLKSKGISGGDIRLCSCSTGQGDDSFAQQLSEIHNGKVKAPDDDVYYAPDEGTVFVGDPNMNIGRWRIFKKGAEIND